jgi:hypothetical protein
MDPEMALGAFGQKGLSPAGFAEGIAGTPPCRQCFRMSQSQPTGMEMGLVTLKTKEGLVLLEKVVCNGTVGIVTDGAVFENRRMFEDKGSLLIAVTVEAEVVEPFGRFQVIHQRSVVLMAAAARHFAFFQRMPRRKIGFDSHIGMTVETELGIGLFQAICVMDVVAVRAPDFTQCVISQIPVCHLKGLVTLQADL